MQRYTGAALASAQGLKSLLLALAWLRVRAHPVMGLQTGPKHTEACDTLNARRGSTSTPTHVCNRAVYHSQLHLASTPLHFPCWTSPLAQSSGSYCASAASSWQLS